MFDEMVGSYDDITDLWYSWLFSRIHLLLAENVIRTYRPKHVLDVGCGTGFQSILHARGGASVLGIDVSRGLVEEARRKVEDPSSLEPCPLFPSRFPFVLQYSDAIDRIVEDARQGLPVTPPAFAFGDAEALPVGDETFDHVSSVGSVLSFVKEPVASIREMARALRPGGSLFLEVESRWNPDVLWTTLDYMFRGVFGFEASRGEVRRLLFAKRETPVKIDYPFGDPDSPAHMQLTLFTVPWIRKLLTGAGIAVKQIWSVHSFTNLIPSTLLDDSRPRRSVVQLFDIFRRAEERAPWLLPGCSLVFLGVKS